LEPKAIRGSQLKKRLSREGAGNTKRDKGKKENGEKKETKGIAGRDWSLKSFKYIPKPNKKESSQEDRRKVRYK